MSLDNLYKFDFVHRKNQTYLHWRGVEYVRFIFANAFKTKSE